MALETLPASQAIRNDPSAKKEYDEKEGERLASWCWELHRHDANGRKDLTREQKWDEDWNFIKGNQWSGAMPSYRRPVKMNAWRRAYQTQQAIINGGRPTLKIVPQGEIPESVLSVWQDALWAVLRNEHVFEVKMPDAYGWAWVGDGGWLKLGYGRYSNAPGEQADVQISAPHPKKVFPDIDCTDPTLTHCHHISYHDHLDLATITSRYPGTGKLVEPDSSVSTPWAVGQSPEWAKVNNDTISTGGWRLNERFRRAKAEVLELWIDDPAIETYHVKEIVNLEQMIAGWMTRINGNMGGGEKIKLLAMKGEEMLDLLPELIGRYGDLPITPEIRPVERWRYAYPYGRLITCTRRVTLRDIPNPYGKAFGWKSRWPFVFVAGTHIPNTLWRPGLLSDMTDTQWAINKSLSLLLESEIKCTNPMIVADVNALEDEDWDMLTLFPGVKIRKQNGTDFNVVFPQPLPEHAFTFPDYMIRKLEEGAGLHDPPLPPGQAVSAKTVSFLQQKGSYLIGEVAKLGDEAIERMGQRIIGLMRDRYVPGRKIPYFEGKVIGPEQKAGTNPEGNELPQLPESMQVRVEATSAYQEQVIATQAMAAEAEKSKQIGRRRGR